MDNRTPDQEILDLLHRATETNTKDRAVSNLALVQNLFDLVEKNPDLRFGQILVNYGFVKNDSTGHWRDEFFLESSKTLQRVEERRRQDRVGPGIPES